MNNRLLNTICLLVILVLTNCTQSDRPLKTGKRIADFYLDTLSHQRFYLNQQQEHITILLFWATWCRACKTQMTALEKQLKQPQWKNVTVAAICTDPENVDQIKEIYSGLKLSYPILMDTKSKLFNKYKLKALPTTLIIDQDQTLRFIRIGFDANVMNQIKSKVVRLIAGR